MVSYVFDLDQTLYQNVTFNRNDARSIGILCRSYFHNKNYSAKSAILSNIIVIYKKYFHRDKKLISLLQKIKGDKHVITNSRPCHCFTALSLLGISKFFKFVMNTDTQKYIKPHPQIYQNLIDHNKNKKTQYIFFDDLIENLITAKKMGWKTVLINSHHIPKDHEIVKKYAEHIFPNIYQALNYFIKIQ